MLQRALVALGHEAPAVDDEDGEGPGQRATVVEDLVEQWVEVHAARHFARRPLLGRPVHAGGLRRQRDESAHTEERNDNRAALVSAGFSCCTQWAAPSTTVVPRKSGNAAAISSAASGIMSATGSSTPVRKPVGMV